MVRLTDYRAVVIKGSSREFACTGVTNGEWRSFTNTVFCMGAAYAYSAMGHELEPGLFTDTAYTAARSIRKMWSGEKVTGDENKELGRIKQYMNDWAESSRGIGGASGNMDSDWFNTQTGAMAKKLYMGKSDVTVSCADMCLSSLSRIARVKDMGMVVFLSETDKRKEPETGQYMNVGHLFAKLKDYLTGDYYHNNLEALECTVRKQNRFDDEVTKMAERGFAGSGSRDRRIFTDDIKSKADEILMLQLCIMSLIAVILYYGSRNAGSNADLVISDEVKEYFQVRSGNEKVHLVIDSASAAVSCAYLFEWSFNPIHGHRQELRDGMVLYSDRGLKVYTVRYLSSLDRTMQWVGDKVRMMIDTVIISDSVAGMIDNETLREDIRACVGHDVEIHRAATNVGRHSCYVDLYLDANFGMARRYDYRISEPQDIPDLLCIKETVYSGYKEKNM